MPKSKGAKKLTIKQFQETIKTIKKPKKESTEKEQLKWRFIRPLKHAQKNIDFLRKKINITADILKKECKITYLFDAINQIALAKNVVITKIPTPFGECDFKKLKGTNYLAKIQGVAQAATTFDVLLYIIKKFNRREDYEKKIKDFVALKVDDEFTINTATTGMSIPNQLYAILNKKVKYEGHNDGQKCFQDELGKLKKNFQITYDQAASLLCGILAISETVRFGGSGKMVRSVARSKKGIVFGLEQDYPLSEPGSNDRMRKNVIDKAEDKKMEQQMQTNANDHSPESTLLDSTLE